MRTTYAVTWRNDTPNGATGRLELGADALELDGRCEGHLVREKIPYRELEAVTVGRTRNERIDGRPTLILERRGGAVVRIAAVAQSWIVSELAQRLAALDVPTPAWPCF